MQTTPPPPGLQAVADNVANHQQRGILRSLHDEIEVAADLLGGGQERRSQLQAGALGQRRRGQRVADRPQVVQLVLGHLEKLAQRREFLVARRGFAAKPNDQRVLPLLALAHVADVVLPRVGFGMQPPKLPSLILFALPSHSKRSSRTAAPHVPSPEWTVGALTCDHLVTYSSVVTDDDRVFKALADPTRRFLLDRLFARDGRTLTELESELEMTRFGVMKHLRVLEDAGLVVTRRSGREKLHFLNPVPIRLIHDRWIDKYTERQVSALADLKTELEETA